MTSPDNTFEVTPIGEVSNDFVDEVPDDYKDKISVITVFKGYEDALLGIDEHSHLAVFSWFHRSDRTIQRVHPMGDKSNPLTGVFATRSPVRPNPIAMTVCELVERDGREMKVKGLDALNGTPVVDIKSYRNYEVDEPEYPDWIPR